MRVLSVIHGPSVRSELFGDVIRDAGHELAEWEIGSGPQPGGELDAVLVLGGHQNVGEEARYPWLEDEYAALEAWVADGVPLFAVCLGAQTLAHALGAAVERRDEQLAGFYPTTLTDEGVADPVLGALPREFEPFNGNAYAFALPRGAVLLADGPCLQAFRAGARAWAVQFHPELERPSFLSWFPDRPLGDVTDKLAAWRPLGARLFRAFLAAAG